MSRKRKNTRKRATKQFGGDTMMIENDTGLFFLRAPVHQGRVTTVYSGPKKLTTEDAREAFNDALYRGIEVGDD